MKEVLTQLIQKSNNHPIEREKFWTLKTHEVSISFIQIGLQVFCGHKKKSEIIKRHH